ncbi:MAG: J domain-containing protein [bacterium]
MINNLRILNLQKGASPEEIKCAYRELVKKWHPDLFYQDSTLRQRAETKLKQINKAYNQLQANNFSEIINEQPRYTPHRAQRDHTHKPKYLHKFVRLINDNIFFKKSIHIMGYTLLSGCIFSAFFLGLMLLWLLCIIITIILF